MVSTTEEAVHPGAYVREQVIPQGMTVTKASTLLGVGRPALSNFLNGGAALSQEMARRLERTFGADREYLLSLQARFDGRDEVMRTRVVAGRHAPTLIEIRAQRIENWADTTRAREELPALLRRLIHTTGEKIICADFPAFDNAQRPGWDGLVETTMPTPWIPEGRSVWEVGCGKSPRRKANGDYYRRVEQVSRAKRGTMTFVFVTPRVWTGKREWATEKAAIGEWKGVRAYDADDLEQWLEQSAPTQVWFAERLDDKVNGYRSLDRCWSDWSQVCDPPLSAALFSEPEGSSAAFRRWLDTPPERPFVVAADSPGEALAYSCHLVNQARSDTDQPGAAALVFDAPEALYRFRAANASPRIAIIHDTEVEREIGDLYLHCHCIIVRPAKDVESKPDVRLQLPDWGKFSEALKAMGLSDDHRIEQLARESGRAPMVLRRRLATVPAIRVPAWASDSNRARKLIPAVLAGAWRQASSSDCEVLRRLAQSDDDGDVESAVLELLDLPDPPLWLAGEYRGVVSRIDSLFGVAHFVTGQDLDLFFSMAERVLSEPDPSLDLPEDERWAAAVHKKVRIHSSALREGMRETLVLLSVHGAVLFRNRGGIDLKARVSSLIRQMLTPLTVSQLLSHLDDLPDYAEAAPDTFLKLIEADLQKQEPAVNGLMKPADSHPFGRCSRTTLLWALEGLGWQQLGRVSAILARLSSIAINDNYANTPINSLEGLYRCWLPRTAATLEERMDSLETLTRQYPDAGWQICMAQLKAGPKFAFRGHQPRWRDDSLGIPHEVTPEAFRTFRLVALKLVLAWPNHNQTTLTDLVELLPDLPDDHRGQVWDLVDDWADGNADDKAKASLRECIRRSVSTRRRPQGRTPERSKEAYDRLEPQDLVIRHSWLFSSHWIEHSADEVEEGDLDYEQRTERIRALRISAIGEIWLERGLDGLTTVLADCGAPMAVGEALTDHIVEPADQVEFIRQCLLVVTDLGPNMDLCIHGFLSAMENSARNALVVTATEGAATDEIARLLCCAPIRQQTWRLLDRYAPEVRDRYWRQVMPTWDRYTEAELFELVDRLLNARRPRAAFSAAHLNWSAIATPHLKRLLLDIGKLDAEPADQYLPKSYDISEAMRELDGRDDIDPEEMIRLEFMHIQALDHSKHGIPNLERWVSASPIGFVQILALLFERDDGQQDPPEWRRADTENRAALGSAAYRLLARIRRLPGTDNGGAIDVTDLSRWIKETRRLCTEYGRARVGDEYIGQLLARGPADEEGIQPCAAVSEAMEGIRSQDIASGFAIGMHNARGFFSRTVGEGGRQERDLAQRYRSWARRRSPNYPYVGSILEGIAADYDRQALREDDEAEIERRLGR